MRRVQFTGEVQKTDSTAPAQQQTEKKSDAPESTTQTHARLYEKKKKDKSSSTSQMRETLEDSDSDEKIPHSKPVIKKKKPSSVEKSGSFNATPVEVDRLANQLLEALQKKSTEKLKDELEWMERRGLRFDRPPLSAHKKIQNFQSTIVVTVFKDCGEKITSEVAGLIARLLMMGCDPNARDDWDNTPLMLTCKAGHKGLLEFMLNTCPKIRFHAINGNGLNAAMVASEANQKHLLLMLDRAGISLHPRNPAITFYTLVQHTPDDADYTNRVAIVMNLLKQGEYLNLIDESGKTLLMHAAIQGDIKMINALWNFELEPMFHIKDADGKDVFDHANALQDKYLANLVTSVIESKLRTSY